MEIWNDLKSRKKYDSTRAGGLRRKEIFQQLMMSIL